MTWEIPPGPGRPPGLPNKSTARAREAIAAFVDSNTELLNDLLRRIAQDNPKAAFDAIMSVVEYHIPKLARSEIENKMTIAFEPLVIERTAPVEVIDVTPVEVKQPE